MNTEQLQSIVAIIFGIIIICYSIYIVYTMEQLKKESNRLLRGEIDKEDFARWYKDNKHLIDKDIEFYKNK